MHPIREILVATDFAECSKGALDRAIDLAGKLGAHLTVMHSYEIPSYVYTGASFSAVDLVTPIEEAAQKCLDDTMVNVRERAPSAKAILRRGPPWEQILEVAKDGHADLVVVGTHGRRGLSHALLGSVAEKVVRLSAVPVLTVRGATA
jgi:nucleotide-binding universal stress UspA family protein